MITIKQIENAIVSKKISYTVYNEKEIELHGPSISCFERYNYKNHVKFVRIFQNNQFNFGEIYDRVEITLQVGDWARFIPLEWIVVRKNHLPKWW